MIMDRRHVLQSYNYIINNILQVNTSECLHQHHHPEYLGSVDKEFTSQSCTFPKFKNSNLQSIW